jgi:hypothetical protein
VVWNVRNLDKAIAIVKRSGKIDMRFWQRYMQDISTTEEQAKYRGTACCIAGWISLSPEFQEDGGSVGTDGAPEMNAKIGIGAIAEWLDISYPSAMYLCMPYSEYYNEEEVKQEAMELLKGMKHKWFFWRNK